MRANCIFIELQTVDDYEETAYKRNKFEDDELTDEIEKSLPLIENDVVRWNFFF